MEIISIAAVAENNVIGNKGKIPWHFVEDFKRFKKLTLNCPVIMGRKTYESLPIKPLPKRTNIIISRNYELKIKGSIVFHSIDEAINYCEKKNADKVFIIGGEMIYRMAMPLVDKLEITRVHIHPKGDTFFPEIDENEWGKLNEEKNKEFSFITYVRKNV